MTTFTHSLMKTLRTGETEVSYDYSIPLCRMYVHVRTYSTIPPFSPLIITFSSYSPCLSLLFFFPPILSLSLASPLLNPGTPSWTTLSWPYKIEDQIIRSEEQMEQDEQKFLKKLSDDQAQMDDKLDTLEMVVAGFSARTDLSRAAETANEVRRVMKDLKECQTQATLYNQRERLFNAPVTQVSRVMYMYVGEDPVITVSAYRSV